MVKVSTSSVFDGLVPSEKVARIEMAGGEIEEVSVSADDISPDNELMAYFIGRDDKAGRVLVELPRESASGRWRLWVNATSIKTSAAGA